LSADESKVDWRMKESILPKKRPKARGSVQS
jgi:hypothetical protein